MSAFGGKADIAAKLLTKDEARRDRGEYRQAACFRCQVVMMLEGV
jgi:hypothetical protein